MALTRTTAVIVNYNAGTALAACVESVEREVGEVIVVDNGSLDGSVEQVERAHPNVRIVRTGRNAGFSVACNLGATIATGDRLLFLNPDCVVEKGSVERLHDALERSERIGMAGAFLLHEDGREQAGARRAAPTTWRVAVEAWGLWRLARFWPRAFAGLNLHRQPVPDGPLDVEATSGACMLVKREALNDVGPLDERYFLHCEDLDWCARFRRKGWRIVFVPDARVVHKKGVSSRHRPYFVEWHKHRGMVRYYWKFRGSGVGTLLLPAIIAGVWLHFVIAVARISARRATPVSDGR